MIKCIMKKTYLMPRTIVFSVENEEMLASSTPGFDDGEVISGECKGSFLDIEGFDLDFNSEEDLFGK